MESLFEALERKKIMGLWVSKSGLPGERDFPRLRPLAVQYLNDHSELMNE
jgi:hypothetical protein